MSRSYIACPDCGVEVTHHCANRSCTWWECATCKQFGVLRRDGRGRWRWVAWVGRVSG